METSLPPAACYSRSDGGMVNSAAGTVHASYRTPSTAVLCIGLATGVCMLLGDAILVPITEVGSVACAIGWSATCAACLALSRDHNSGIRLSPIELGVATFGLLVGIAMTLMKLIPAIPGHFTIYEWIALGIWIALGVAAAARQRGKAEERPLRTA